eukprot:CAMPEP_0182483870 /NCGR_PEP_ID=MMETSP1319-20130603/42274_1 /TAXON_ID=172717 /ORGANISM="Bolidomonas pacifica, Strain RCC208" /LENGTH=490 /DNA_ID=CAMNT_0024685717 /DNA_START=169 /DNA_END=1638 /DNA_ORIENTATION=-
MSIPYETPCRFHKHTYTALSEDADSDDDASSDSSSKGTTTTSNARTSARTSSKFIKSQLSSSGVLSASTIGDLNVAVTDFVLSMRATGCYEEFRATLDQATTPSTGLPVPGRAVVRIEARERNWYKVKIGGGLKHEGGDGLSGGFTSSSSSLSLPTVQFESSAKLINVIGDCSTTSAAYNVDQGGVASSHFTHVRPGVKWLGEAMPFSLSVGARQDEADHQSSRSYRETQKGVFCSVRSGPPSSEAGILGQLEWSAALRDVLPSLHPTTPYGVDASPYVVAESGPNFKHAVKAVLSTNHAFTHPNRYVPAGGVDVSLTGELAGPPGDVGLVKSELSSALHYPLHPLLSLHAHVGLGALKALPFGGLCNPCSNISDRFYLGGPLNLRGFGQGGVGPRSDPRGPGADGGDTLGGELYHVSSLQLSTPFPHPVVGGNGVRLFAFGSAGTLCNWREAGTAAKVLGSTRVSAGMGVAVPTPIGRFEVTFAKVLRK